jgi:hypothetical protein
LTKAGEAPADAKIVYPSGLLNPRHGGVDCDKKTAGALRGNVLRRLGFIFAALVLAGAARADLPPGTACSTAGHQAEQSGALPQNLLVSIGMVESGRPDPLTGQVAPWPWTVNADGQGEYFPTKEAAEAFVRFAEASGARDVDVGCFQISLQNHPDAFATLDDAFDPAENAAYAARFLNELKSKTGSWNTAIADYHSALPDLGLPYQRLVLAAWKRIGTLPFGIGDDDQGAGYIAPDETIVLQSAAAKRVHVYSMLDENSAPTRASLPRVIYGD